MIEEINIENLQTVKNYAMANNITTSYIYKLVKEQKMRVLVIDGVQFVQTDKYPTIPVTNRRK